MGLTYVQLKQAILDWTENDATEFTTATGSGVAPVDLCIQLAEQRLVREADITAYRKTYDITLSANNGFFDKGLRFRAMTLPDLFIDQDKPEAQYEVAGLKRSHIVATALDALGETNKEYGKFRPASA